MFQIPNDAQLPVCSFLFSTAEGSIGLLYFWLHSAHGQEPNKNAGLLCKLER